MVQAANTEINYIYYKLFFLSDLKGLAQKTVLQKDVPAHFIYSKSTGLAETKTDNIANYCNKQHHRL